MEKAMKIATEKAKEQVKQGIIKALKRGKLSVEEIAEDNEVELSYVLFIKDKME